MLNQSSLIAIALIVGGCLPGDLRPEPGSLYVTAEASEATANGFVTADGWNVRFDRFLTAVGDVDLGSAPDGDDRSSDVETCNGYGDTHYDWLFDFTVIGREKVGLTYGLGICSVEFRFREPRSDTVLGPGATQRDIDIMRSRASDGFTTDEEISVMVHGQAERDGVIQRFDWVFRRSYELEECKVESGDGYVSVLDMQAGAALELGIVMRGEELFRLAPLDEAPLEFDLFAEADADGDGAITLVELAKVEAPVYEWPEGEEPPPEASQLSSADAKPPTLADLVYLLNLPRLARIAGGGPCKPELRERWR